MVRREVAPPSGYPYCFTISQSLPLLFHRQVAIHYPGGEGPRPIVSDPKVSGTTLREGKKVSEPLHQDSLEKLRGRDQDGVSG